MSTRLSKPRAERPHRSRKLVASAALGFVVLPFALWACNAHNLEAPVPQPVGENRQYREVNPIRDVDILFVVDNSNSMMQEQANLTRNFPAFMDELKKIEGGLPNVHVGVVSSDMGAGVMSASPNCSVPGGDKGILANVRTKDLSSCGLNLGQARYLKALNNNTETNFTGDISQVFSCLATLGTGGCGFEHSLGAARAALTAPENAGFLRENAYLAIIIITDEDDCTGPADSDLFTSPIAGQAWSFRCATQGHTCGGMATPAAATSVPLSSCQASEGTKLVAVQDFVKDITKLKNDPNQIIVAGIFGWPEEGTANPRPYAVRASQGELNLAAICNSANGDASPALRVKAFVESFANNTFSSICQDDFRKAMAKIGEKIKVVVGPPCVDAPLFDTDPKAANVQPDCRVTEKRGGVETLLPSCDAAGGKMPCWKEVHDESCTASRYKIEIRRATEAPPGTRQAVTCLTTPASVTPPRTR